jgi:hypothetical protein
VHPCRCAAGVKIADAALVVRDAVTFGKANAIDLVRPKPCRAVLNGPPVEERLFVCLLIIAMRIGLPVEAKATHRCITPNRRTVERRTVPTAFRPHSVSAGRQSARRQSRFSKAVGSLGPDFHVGQVLCDTSGRLRHKQRLMAELGKMRTSAGKARRK